MSERTITKGWLLIPKKIPAAFAASLLLPALILCSGCDTYLGRATSDSILNVSYDPTREFFREYNAAFVKHWRQKTGREATILQSHGGSAKQARAIISGLEADVVTLVLPYDIDAIQQTTGKIARDWQSRFPHDSSPFTSMIVFLVRKGNPKGVHDWEDLIRPGISVIAPNPKTSGAARWIYIAAWGYAKKSLGATEEQAREFVGRLYNNVPILDKGSRSSSITFAMRGIGDVLLTWESEAFLVTKEINEAGFEIVVPSISVLAEPSVAVLDAVAGKHGSREIAEEYLRYLYGPVGQEIAAKHYYRPRDSGVAEKYAGQFPKTKLFSIEELYPSWREAQRIHFSDGGEFDGIYKPGAAE